MDDLTLEQAERCAKALWGDQDIHPKANNKNHWHTEVSVVYEDELSLDPYYYFPRLWDKLDTITDCDGGDPDVWSLTSSKKHGEYRGYVDGQGGFTGSSPCLALCEAIEALEAK